MSKLPDSFPAFDQIAPGEVWLVGAGPGDPRLMTLAAANAIGQADVVVHDALIDRRILGLAKADCRIISAGKRGGRPSTRQAEITATLIAEARAGGRVVRLKGGDPFVFGRGGEEAMALAEAGVRFRVVPGLTAGLAGPALAGIPATTRDTNHAVILATGHHMADANSITQWAALARTGQPLMLYMAIANLGSIAEALIVTGLAPETPVAVIDSATLSEERVVVTTLSDAHNDVTAAGLGSPSMVAIGSVVSLRAKLAPWMGGGDN